MQRFGRREEDTRCGGEGGEARPRAPHRGEEGEGDGRGGEDGGAGSGGGDRGYDKGDRSIWEGDFAE